MRKVNIFFNYILLLIILITSFQTLILSYPGQGECLDNHGLTLIPIPIDDDAVLILDGNASEPFWEESSNQGGIKRIPVATTTHMVKYVNVTFVMTGNFLYINMKWLDNTTIPDLSEGLYYDGLFFCWDINVPGFTANFNGMDTVDMGGGTIDSWQWRCEKTLIQILDKSMDEGGWNSEFEPNNIELAYQIDSNKSYSVEIKRALTTSDKGVDVQFDEEKLYKFNIAILDDDRHQAHYISWTYSLDLRPEEATDDDDKTDNNSEESLISGFFFISIIILTFSIVLVIKTMRSTKFQTKI